MFKSLLKASLYNSSYLVNDSLSKLPSSFRAKVLLFNLFNALRAPSNDSKVNVNGLR